MVCSSMRSRYAFRPGLRPSSRMRRAKEGIHVAGERRARYASLLRRGAARGVDTLIITGVTTSGCIRATCLDSCQYGFIPIVVADACGDRHPAPHEANLFDMNAKYGDVVSEAETLAYLNTLEQHA